MSITAEAARSQIATGETDPLYLVLGEDTAEKAELASAFAEAVDPDFRAFNVQRFYGAEASLDDVLDAARTLPLMSPRRILIVTDADRLLEPKRENEASARALKELEAYVPKPLRHASIVFIADRLDKRRKLTGLLLKHATIVDCAGIDAVGPDRWVRNTVTRQGMQIEPPAVRTLLARAGNDFSRLRKDVERVMLFAAASGRITEADVLEVVGPATSQDDWAVTRAIEQGAVSAALRELALALDGGAVPYAVLGQLGWYVRTKLPAARVRQAVDALFRTDLELKTSAGDPRVLLERLVVELCTAGRR
jgi:DNA polymerase III subunit delta